MGDMCTYSHLGEAAQLLGGGSGSLQMLCMKSRTSDEYPDPLSEHLLTCSIFDLHDWGVNRGEILETVLNMTAFLYFRFLSVLLGGKFLCVDKMPPASPGPIQTEASEYMKITKALLPTFFVDFFFVVPFFFHSIFPSCFRPLSSPSLLSTVSLCICFPFACSPFPLCLLL